MLLPAILFFTVVATFYYSLGHDHSFKNSLWLGTIMGIMVGIITSAVASLILAAIEAKSNTSPLAAKELQGLQSLNDGVHIPSSESKILMVLMDKDLAFEVVLHSVVKYAMGEIHHKDKKSGSITVSTKASTIDIYIFALTKHTSKIEIKSDYYNREIHKIIDFIKEKEKSFITYG